MPGAARVIITENPDKTQALMDALKETFRETRGRAGDTEIHLSDLMYPRKSFFGRTTDVLPTATEVLLWTAGRAHEDVVARLGGAVTADIPRLGAVAGLEVGERRVRQGIQYRPDFRWYGLPAEMKTRRKPLPKPGEEAEAFSGYLEQLLGYCVLDGAPSGSLFVFDLMTPAFAVYDVQFLNSEIQRWKMELQTRLTWLKYSLQGKHHQQLPLCPAWMCGTQTKRLVVPAFCQDCNQDLTSKQVQQHDRSKKKYKGHMIRPPIFTWDYTKRCKWYDDCAPYKDDESRRAWV
jgi:hypothetical protein